MMHPSFAAHPPQPSGPSYDFPTFSTAPASSPSNPLKRTASSFLTEPSDDDAEGGVAGGSPLRKRRISPTGAFSRLTIRDLPLFNSGGVLAQAGSVAGGFPTQAIALLPPQQLGQPRPSPFAATTTATFPAFVPPTPVALPAPQQSSTLHPSVVAVPSPFSDTPPSASTASESRPVQDEKMHTTFSAYEIAPDRVYIESLSDSSSASTPSPDTEGVPNPFNLHPQVALHLHRSLARPHVPRDYPLHTHKVAEGSLVLYQGGFSGRHRAWTGPRTAEMEAREAEERVEGWREYMSRRAGEDQESGASAGGGGMGWVESEARFEELEGAEGDGMADGMVGKEQTGVVVGQGQEEDKMDMD